MKCGPGSALGLRPEGFVTADYSGRGYTVAIQELYLWSSVVNDLDSSALVLEKH